MLFSPGPGTSYPDEQCRHRVKQGLLVSLWDERPLACVVLKEGEDPQGKKEEILELLSQRFPKWWLPNEILFINEIPKTSVGKFDKKTLRKRYIDYYLKG